VATLAQAERALIREICRSANIEILQSHIRPDHIHLLLSVTTHLALSLVMQAIKRQDLPPSPPGSSEAAVGVWGRHLWARGYFGCSSNGADEIIARYIRLQGAEPQGDDRFRVTEE
jgi:REP-associated tyrosine transposase